MLKIFYIEYTDSGKLVLSLELNYQFHLCFNFNIVNMQYQSRNYLMLSVLKLFFGGRRLEFSSISRMLQ